MQENAEAIPNEEAVATAEAPSFDPQNLSDDLRDEPSLRNFNDVNKLAKSYVHLVKKLGVPAENIIKLPNEGESWDEVYNQLGRPNDPADYGIPNNSELSNELHKLGINKSQAEGIYNYVKNKGETANAISKEQFKEQQSQAVNKLRGEWGENFDSYATKARQAFLQLADANTVNLIDRTGLGNQPEIVKIFHKVSQILEEDGLLNTDIGGVGAGGKAQMQSRLAEIMKSDSPYWNRTHPDHDNYVEEALKLREIML